MVFLHVLGKIYKLRLKLSHRDFMYMPVTKKNEIQTALFKIDFFFVSNQKGLF